MTQKELDKLFEIYNNTFENKLLLQDDNKRVAEFRLKNNLSMEIFTYLLTCQRLKLKPKIEELKIY